MRAGGLTEKLGIAEGLPGNHPSHPNKLGWGTLILIFCSESFGWATRRLRG